MAQFFDDRQDTSLLDNEIFMGSSWFECMLMFEPVTNYGQSVMQL